MIVIFHQDWPGDLENAAHYYEAQAGRELRQDFIREAFATVERIKAQSARFYGTLWASAARSLKAIPPLLDPLSFHQA